MAPLRAPGFVGHLIARFTVIIGGPARRRVVILLAGVLALNAADSGVVGSVVTELRHSFGISNTEVGVLTAVPAVVGAVATVPVGQLTDRVRRVPLLVASIALWSIAMIAGGLVDSYWWLLVSRVGLGAVSATAGLTIASLAGDLFPPVERGRLYGYVLAGELVGAGFGLLAGGDVSALFGWRSAFWLVAGIGFGLAAAVWWMLPEPARGGASRLSEGASRIRPAGTAGDRGRDCSRTDPEPMTLWQAARYVLSIHTNLYLIAASAIGYFFFAGLRTFAMEFVQAHYGVQRAELTGLVLVIGIGALTGTLLGGRFADALVERGVVTARVLVPGFAYMAAALLFLCGLVTRNTLIAVAAFTLAGGSLAAANPPLDAARLDIVPSWLWGRAESIRTILRMAAESTAPIVFGLVSQAFATGSQAGLDQAFLVMLVPLLASGLLVVRARRRYPADAQAASRLQRTTDV